MGEPSERTPLAGLPAIPRKNCQRSGARNGGSIVRNARSPSYDDCLPANETGSGSMQSVIAGIDFNDYHGAARHDSMCWRRILLLPYDSFDN
jgi:hypothetical protein